MRLINTVLGTVIKMDSGEEIIAPACLSQAIQELKVKLENAQVAERHLRQKDQEIAANMTTLHEEIKALRLNLKAANNITIKQEQQIINQRNSIEVYQTDIKVLKANLANMGVTSEETTSAATDKATDSPECCRFHEYLFSTEGTAQRLEIYKQVMGALQKQVISASIQELLSIRKILV